MSNIGWRQKFPTTTITHLVSRTSNHLPLILQTISDGGFCVNGAWGFKFEESWLLWDDCEMIVDGAWSLVSRAGSAVQAIKEKIKGCGESLFEWGASKTHPDTKEIKKLQEQVDILNGSALTKENKAKFLNVSKRLDDLFIKQKIYWHQCSRVYLMKNEFKNTKFFHSKASQRQSRNFIQGIRNQ